MPKRYILGWHILLPFGFFLREILDKRAKIHSLADQLPTI